MSKLCRQLLSLGKIDLLWQSLIAISEWGGLKWYKMLSRPRDIWIWFLMTKSKLDSNQLPYFLFYNYLPITITPRIYISAITDLSNFLIPLSLGHLHTKDFLMKLLGIPRYLKRVALKSDWNLWLLKLVKNRWRCHVAAQSATAPLALSFLVAPWE